MATNNAINQLATIPSFYAYITADTAAVTGDGTVVTVPLNNELYDTTSSFNTGTYTFTAPYTGVYMVSGHIYGNPFNTKTSCVLSIVTTARTYTVSRNLAPLSTAASYVATAECVSLVDMTAGDTMYLQLTVAGGTKNLVINGQRFYTWFTGYFLF